MYVIENRKRKRCPDELAEHNADTSLSKSATVQTVELSMEHVEE